MRRIVELSSTSNSRRAAMTRISSSFLAIS
jgi:hypothetical protein